MIPDVLTAIRSLMLADPDIATLTSGRVFRVRLPASEADYMPRNAVVISRAGGRPDIGYVPLARQRIDVRCYGSNDQQAFAVLSAVHPLLKQLRRSTVGDCMIHNAMPEIEHVDFLEEEVNWPVCLCSYLVMYSEIAVAA